MYKITFVGLSRLNRQLSKLGREVSVIRLNEGGNAIQRAARRYVPVLTGALRRSITVLPKIRGSRIVAGVGLPRYAAVQERGRYHNIRPHYYMRRAGSINVANAVKKDVDKIIRKSF